MNDKSYTPLKSSKNAENKNQPAKPITKSIVSPMPLPHPADVKDSLELVRLHMTVHQLSAGWNRVSGMSDEFMSYSDHEDDLILWAMRNGVSRKMYGSRELGAAYRKIQREQYKKIVREVAESISAPADSSVEAWDFSRLADALGWSEVDALCMIWWMKDRKRALLEMARGRTPEVRQVPMPVLYSRKQKTGKSFFIERLCEPFGELCEVKNISEIEDKFNFIQWGKLLIANFDEMAGLDKTDMNLLKQWAFQKKFTKRKMQSEQQNHIHKTVAGIGSSNDPIEEIVWDSTGTRRFCQINIITDGRYIETAKTADFLNVWRSIDHRSQLSDVEQDLIYQEQDKQRRKDKVEYWFEDAGKLLLTGKSNGVSGADLYVSFTMWCAANGEKAYTSTLFGRRVKTIYEKEIDHGKTGGIIRYKLKT